MFRIWKNTALLLSVLSLSACALTEIKPWERDILARESMQVSAHPFIKLADEKIYFSKEASNGGQGIGGGGCGCN